MAKRYRNPHNEHTNRGQIIKPDSTDYVRYKRKFDDFPSKKRYSASRPKTGKNIPTESRKGKKSQRPSSYRGIPGIPDKPVRPAEFSIHGVEERFDKAFIISLGLIALLSLLIFIPILGPLMALTLVPYIACYRGCRHVSKSNGVQVGILIGIVWSIIELNILFQILETIKISVAEPGIYTNIDLAIIIVIFIANLIFCIFGGYMGGAKFESLQLEAEENGVIDYENIQLG